VPAFQVPPASADPNDHADWLELAALVAADQDSSAQDLMAAIRRGGSIDALDDPEEPDDPPLDEHVERENDELERLADAALERLAFREECLGEAYPFVVDGALTAKPGAAESIYAFLVAITSVGWRNEEAPESAASLFELVSAATLVSYLGGSLTAQSYDFGFPRREGPSAFYDAVQELCQEMGEGLGCRVPEPETKQVKDSKLDLVGWIPFGDGRNNQLSVFGQCATGANWRGKINELQPVDFCKRWLKEQPAVNPSLAFFVPRHIEEQHWPEASIGEHRLLFDRLRIVSVLHELDDDLARRCAQWTESAIR
jgi:hypothetical protein